MGRARARRLPWIVALPAALWTAAGPTPAEEPPALVRETWVRLHVEVLHLGPEPGPLGELTLEVPPDAAERRDLALAWPGSDPPSQLDLEATARAGPAGGEHEVSLLADLSVGGAPPVRSGRTLALQEGSTGWMEVFATERERLVLAVQAESFSRPVLRSAVRVGRPVLLRLEVERVSGERSIPLEVNRLTTFVLAPVEYAFRRGQADQAESVQLVLTPVRIEGDVALVEAEVSGTLPSTGGPLVLSRREMLVTTRGATSSLTVAVGDPPSGYRFLLVPDF